MSYPSYSHFVGTIHGILSAKASWLAEESQTLAAIAQAYGDQAADFSHREVTTLTLAAYYKNLGGIYLPREQLTGKLSTAETRAYTKTWHLLSARIATHANLPEVANLLEHYCDRAIPGDRLSSTFQVLNCWASCRQEKPYRPGMSIQDSKMSLLQRVEMGWSDGAVVDQFLRFLGI